MPSHEHPLTGRCACGAVRFEVTEPFQSAGYCHCHRCQRRSGLPWTFNGLVEPSGFELIDGAEALMSWRPEEGARSKSFCRHCGGHVFGGDRNGLEAASPPRLGLSARGRYAALIASRSAFRATT
jgi:hypothetical protein